MKIGSGFKSTPLKNKDTKNASINGTPKAKLFSNGNADPKSIESHKSTPKQNGSLTRQDSLNDIDDDDDEENPFFDFHTESKDAEELYSEALLEEVKQLQVRLFAMLE